MAAGSNLIALVTRLSPEAEQGWLATLRRAMPNETILSIREMDENQRQCTDIAIVANPDPADLRRLPRLAWVHSLWAGVERLVLELQDFSRPIVRLVDPKLSETMAEAALAWTLYLSRDMPAYAAQQRQRRWEQLTYRAAGDTRVGILGLGALGRAAALKLTQVGFQVSGWSRQVKTIDGIVTHSGETGLNSLLAQSDILICLLPLTAETTGLINAEKLALLPPQAGVINFARGRIIATGDLVAALDEGRVKHAVLDVFDIEPLDMASPLWSHPRITVLPHISAPTNQDTAAAIVATNIATYRATDALPPTIDFERGY